MSELPLQSTEKNNLYNLEGINDELLAHYKPEFIGIGSEHIVFQVPDHPGVVIKVSIESILESLNWQHSFNATIDEYTEHPDVQRELQYRIDLAETAYRGVAEHFPRTNLLPQRYIQFTVPVTPELIHRLARHYYNGEVVAAGEVSPDAVHVVAMVQRRNEEMAEGTAESLFDRGYVVTEELAQDTLGEYLFPGGGGRSEVTQVPVEQQAALRDFVIRAIEYSHATGSILDISGPNNVIFKNTDSGLSYQLVDAVYPAHWEKSISRFTIFMQEALANNFHCGIGKMEQFVSTVVNVTDYIYKINQMAESLGMSERLDPLQSIPITERSNALEFIQECYRVRADKNARL